MKKTLLIAALLGLMGTASVQASGPLGIFKTSLDLTVGRHKNCEGIPVNIGYTLGVKVSNVQIGVGPSIGIITSGMYEGDDIGVPIGVYGKIVWSPGLFLSRVIRPYIEARAGYAYECNYEENMPHGGVGIGVCLFNKLRLGFYNQFIRCLDEKGHGPDTYYDYGAEYVPTFSMSIDF